MAIIIHILQVKKPQYRGSKSKKEMRFHSFKKFTVLNAPPFSLWNPHHLKVNFIFDVCISDLREVGTPSNSAFESVSLPCSRRGPSECPYATGAYDTIAKGQGKPYRT